MVNVRNTRIPRGYDIARPYYEEMCEGVRPTVQAIPLEAWTGLAPIRIDEVHHDPIVLEPGTIVGICTGGIASGKLLPAHYASSGVTGNATILPAVPTLSGVAHTDNTKWGLASANFGISVGYVKPVGVLYQPVYSFNLQNYFTNYTRNVNVGIVCDYVIQIPAITAEEVLINNGDVVMVGSGAWQGAVTAANGYQTQMWAGRYRKWAPELTATTNWPGDATGSLIASQFIVGRCLRKIALGTTSGSAGTVLKDEIVAGRFTLGSEAVSEFKNLAKVQTAPAGGTNPGNPLAGSGSAGVPGWLLGAVCDANKTFYALTLLIRL